MGLRFSPVNWHLVPDEISYIVDDCDADVVFFGKEYASNVSSIRPRCPKVKAWVCMDGVVDDSCASMDQLFEQAPIGAKPPTHNRKGGKIQYTGGTTGKPKGAVRSGPPLNPARRKIRLRENGMVRMLPHPVQLVAAPLYHAMPGAWMATGVILGTTFVLMSKFNAAQALDSIDKYKVNGFYMPPILLKRLLQVPESVRARHSLKSVRTIMVAGAPCPSYVKRGIVAMMGPVLYELYGASETGAVTIMDPENMLKKPLSCGKIVEGMSVMLLDDDKKEITTTHTQGEIYSKGSTIDHYHKLEAKTTEARFGDYFTVGDVGYFDEDGFLYISDRKIDMVISGGANIYPAQVEEVIHQHPDVEDVAVFGLPDPEYGEIVFAVLKLVEGKKITGKELLEWCRGKIGKFQLPKEKNITFYGKEFPRTDAGKLRKKALKAQIQQQQSAQVQQPISSKL
jgi:long-chain acyl-CoA synthetase